MRIVHRQRAVIITRDDENRAERSKNWKKNCSSETRGFGWEERKVSPVRGWLAWSTDARRTDREIEGGSERERLNAD